MWHKKPHELKKSLLYYNEDKWEEIIPQPVNTLQVFITNECNLRCKGCFYERRLGVGTMTLDEYKNYLALYVSKWDVRKITLLGGEPTIHPELGKIIDVNTKQNLKTTIYTNGYFLDKLRSIDLQMTSIRLSVYGFKHIYKSLRALDGQKFEFSLLPVFMVNKENTKNILPTAIKAESKFNCTDFYISSIRDIEQTGSFWIDSDWTLPLVQYAEAVNKFVEEYTRWNGKMTLHISRRGILYTKRTLEKPVGICRFGNIFPGGDTVICPFDISSFLRGDMKQKEELNFNRSGTKNPECLLTKTILKRR